MQSACSINEHHIVVLGNGAFAPRSKALLLDLHPALCHKVGAERSAHTLSWSTAAARNVSAASDRDLEALLGN